MCVPDVVKNLNVRVFNLMSRNNETRHIEWHETCKYRCRLGASVCNSKQRGNNDKCRGECKKLIDKGVCDKGFIWNPSNCEYECNKSCDVRYLDYEKCKCRNRLVDKLVEECSENIEEVKLAKTTSADHENVCKSSWTIYVVLIAVIFTINVGIGTCFVYCRYMNHNKETAPRHGYLYQTTSY